MCRYTGWTDLWFCDPIRPVLSTTPRCSLCSGHLSNSQVSRPVDWSRRYERVFPAGFNASATGLKTDINTPKWSVSSAKWSAWRRCCPSPFWAPRTCTARGLTATGPGSVCRVRRRRSRCSVTRRLQCSAGCTSWTCYKTFTGSWTTGSLAAFTSCAHRSCWSRTRL